MKSKDSGAYNVTSLETLAQIARSLVSNEFTMILVNYLLSLMHFIEFNSNQVILFYKIFKFGKVLQTHFQINFKFPTKDLSSLLAIVIDYINSRGECPSI